MLLFLFTQPPLLRFIIPSIILLKAMKCWLFRRIIGASRRKMSYEADAAAEVNVELVR